MEEIVYDILFFYTRMTVIYDHQKAIHRKSLYLLAKFVYAHFELTDLHACRYYELKSVAIVEIAFDLMII